MKPIEEQIIHNLMESDGQDFSARLASEKALIRLAQEEPFGTSSLEFLNHPALNACISKISGSRKNYLML